MPVLPPLFRNLLRHTGMWILVCVFAFGWADGKKTVLRGNGTVGPYLISRFRIDPAAITVVMQGDTLDSRAHYRYLEKENAILMDEPVPDSTLIIIHFRRTMEFLPRAFFRRDPTQIPGLENAINDSLIPLPVPKALEDDATSDAFFQVGGLKTFGISSQSGSGVSVNQSLQIQVQGQIAEGTNLRASLSDQDIPLQPEGTTRTLGEIEQARIDIDGQRFSATLGDYYDREDLQFIRYSKKIQGARGGAEFENWQAGFSAATSRGTFRSFSFMGTEGKQGPYRLPGRREGRGVVVLAGTETLWLDGNRLTRGWNHDYVIDYSAGWIRFTPRRVITSESEITANYEYLEQEYSRTLLHGTSRMKGENWKIRITGVQEKDSPDHPLAFIMSEDDKTMLSASGDARDIRSDSPRLLESQEVGERGFYLKLDSASVSFYRHFPPESLGTHASAQLFAPDFQPRPGGSYDSSMVRDYYGDRPVYHYVGPGNGQFAPGGKLTAPETRRVADIAFEGGTGPWEIRAELAGSQTDMNSLSMLEDDDNVGFGAGLWSGYGTQSDRGPFLELEFDRLDSTFRPFGTNAEDYRDRRRWNFPQDAWVGQTFSQREEATGGWRWRGGSELRAEAGAQQRGISRGTRGAAGATVAFAETGRMEGSVDELRGTAGEISTSLSRLRSGLFLPAAWWGPFSLVEQEWQTSDSLSQHHGYGYRDVLLGMKPGLKGVWEPNWELGLQRYRSSDVPEAYSGADSLEILRLGAGLEMLPQRGFSFQATGNQRRIRRMLVDGHPLEIYDVAELSTRWEPQSGAMRVRNDYRLSSSEMTSYRERYQYVGEGRGSYERDSVTLDYRPREGGGYDRAGRMADSASLGREVTFDTHVRARPSRWRETGGFLDDITSTTRLELYGQKGNQVTGWDRRYWPGWAFNGTDSADAVLQRARLTEDLVFHPGAGTFKTRIRLQPFRENDFHYGKETRSSMLYRVGLEKGFRRKLETRLDLQHETEERHRESSSGYATLDYRIRNREAEAGIRLPLGFGFTPGLKGGAGRSEDLASLSVYDFYFGSPSLTKQLGDHGQIRISYRWQRVVGEGTLYYRMAGGYARGVTHRWDANGDWQLGENMALNLYYLGRLEEETPRPFHQANVDLRAYF